ncbi:DUF1616 domain-containing protein [[Eubacterium] cellulosolvens]
MIIDILRIIFSIFLLFFLPGFFLVQALFPRKNELDEEYDFMYRVILGIVLSIVITTLDGFILGSMGINPSTGKGYWDTPYIFGSLIGISVVLFLIGWYRGAYPLLGRKRYKKAPLKISKKDKQEFYELMDQWKMLHKKLDKYNDLYLDSLDEDKEKYEKKMNEIKKELEKLEERLVELGAKEMPVIKAKEKDEIEEKKAKTRKK